MTKRAFALAALAFVMPGCRGSTQSVDGRSNFVEDGVVKDAPDVWMGERIEVVNAGVTPTGGLALTTPGTDRVHATARMLAIADTQDKPSADRAILSATQTYDVKTNSGVTTVACGHGMTFGSANGIDSGCDALDVIVPSGDAMKHLSVAAQSGNGKVVVTLDTGVVLGELDVHANHGFVDVSVPATPGAVITVVSETGDDITLHLPRDFASDAVVVDTAADKIDTGDFPDVQSGKARGNKGAGAKSISLRSGIAGGLRGRIALVAQ